MSDCISNRNYIVHGFLEVDIYGDPDIDRDDIIENYFPKYLFREQYFKYFQILESYNFIESKRQPLRLPFRLPKKSC